MDQEEPLPVGKDQVVDHLEEGLEEGLVAQGRVTQGGKEGGALNDQSRIMNSLLFS